MMKAEKSVGITINTKVSSEIALAGGLLVGLFMPLALTSTIVTFSGSKGTGGPYALVSDGAGGSYSQTVRAGDYLPLDPSKFAGLDFVVINLDTNEAAARTITAQLLVNA